MPSTPYAPLPIQPTQGDADRDLEDAFAEDDDEEDALESTRLVNRHLQPSADPSHANRPQPIQIPGAYDFERDYDYTAPPPGSPPRPSATALPNDHGNTNGLIPTSPAISPLRLGQGTGRFSGFFQRAVGSILPTHYQTLPTQSPTPRIVGGGIQNDGVFANVMAKPVSSARTVTADGDVFLAPETTQAQPPPTYTEAQADAVPPYWETTVVSASEPGEMIIDDLPAGSVLIFAFNLFTSFFFQFLGFVITYFLSTTHAARYGARAGLGLTFIQYGAYWRAAQNIEVGPSRSEQQEIKWWNETMTEISSSSGSGLSVNATAFMQTMANQTDTGAGEAYYDVGFGGRDWLALFFMTFGWVLLFTSIVGFWRVKRWEMSIWAASRPQQPPTRSVQTRRDVDFSIDLSDERDSDAHLDPQTEAELRLARHLRAAGLI
jgi:hypothetical protein